MYEARFVEFQDGTGNEELGGQKNHSTDTRDKILQKNFLGCGVLGMVKQVAFGKYKGKPAALLAFSFTFRSGDLALRFKKALVKITFDKQPGSSEDSQVPEVQNWAPRKIYGVPNDEEKTWSYCLELQGSIPIGPAQPGLTGRIGSESAFKKAHRMSIIGKRWSSPTSPLLNIAYWEVREQGKTKYGIPDELHVATIVHHEGPFQASVEVTADTPLKNDLFAFPWPKDDPILFHVGKPKGQELAVSDFGLLKDTDWLGLVPWDQEWESVLTGIPTTGDPKHLVGAGSGS